MTKRCDKCRMVNLSVKKTKLKVPGIPPRKCGCIYLCAICLSETKTILQARKRAGR